MYFLASLSQSKLKRAMRNMLEEFGSFPVRPSFIFPSQEMKILEEDQEACATSDCHSGKKGREVGEGRKGKRLLDEILTDATDGRKEGTRICLPANKIGLPHDHVAQD